MGDQGGIAKHVRGGRDSKHGRRGRDSKTQEIREG